MRRSLDTSLAWKGCSREGMEGGGGKGTSFLSLSFSSMNVTLYLGGSLGGSQGSGYMAKCK